MEQHKILSTLGLATRARKIISGEELIIKGIQNKRVFLLIIAEDTSENTKKKLKDKCTFYHVPFIEHFTSQELGHAIGKAPRAAIAIADKNFSKMIERLYG